MGDKTKAKSKSRTRAKSAAARSGNAARAHVATGAHPHAAGSAQRALDAYGTGFDDKLQPTVPLDLSRIHTISDLVEAYGRCAIGARAVGEAAEILEAMAADRDCYVVCTVSGAMTVAKMGLVLCDMIEHGLVDAVITTGALMAHGFVEAAGKLHFKYDPSMSDDVLFERGYNRVFDSIELERNLDDVERIFRAVLEANPDVDVWCSQALTRALGEHLSRHDAGRGILRSAYEHDVPVYVPAFSDSELGLDFAIHGHRQRARGRAVPGFDPFLDVEDYKNRVVGAEKLGIFTIGGGVPRNWAQQVGPYLDLLQKRAGIGSGIRRFEYGVRICPEPTHWGGLSGCTYSEGVSWGKFAPVSEGGRYAEVYADATIVWPLVVKAVLERRAARGQSRAESRGSESRADGGRSNRRRTTARR
jgi:deoxyhypusine synthase